MPSSIADHAFLSNTRGAALVDRCGRIDWLCLPRFDSEACFASLLGTPEHGEWTLEAVGPVEQTHQQYRGDSLVVDTQMQTADGRVCVSDCMPVDAAGNSVVRVVRGLAGRVAMRMCFRPRFGYGARTARFERRDGVVVARDTGSSIAFNASVPYRIESDAIIAEFDIDAGAQVTFAMTLVAGAEPPDPPLDPGHVVDRCRAGWERWAADCDYEGPWRNQVVRSLLTLKGLIYAPTGGIVAAATSSLPEIIGGERNWDYRFCWLRDATFTLYALLSNGYQQEARDWRNWLVETVRPEPFRMHVLYRVDGCHDLDERVLPWLPGYRDSRPVRIGNAASAQFQLDIRGEVIDVLHVARRNGLDVADDARELQLAVLADVGQHWRNPDHGIWEMRGNAAHFVHSKALAWVAFDRCIKAAEQGVLEGPLAHWRAVRDEIRADIYEHGFDRERGVFVQRYGSPELDASVLLLPLVGFVAPDSPEAIATADAVRRELSVDGLLRRYRNDVEVDGLPGHEGAFLPCSFWLVDNLALSGRIDEACELFEHLLGLANHVGLLSEEWDGRSGMLGNIPQGLSHVGLVNSARILSDVLGDGKPRREARPEERSGADPPDARHRRHPGGPRAGNPPTLMENSQ